MYDEKFTDRMQKFRDKEQFEADQPFEHPKENKSELPIMKLCQKCGATTFVEADKMYVYCNKCREELRCKNF